MSIRKVFKHNDGTQRLRNVAEIAIARGEGNLLVRDLNLLKSEGFFDEFIKLVKPIDFIHGWQNEVFEDEFPLTSIIDLFKIIHRDGFELSKSFFDKINIDGTLVDIFIPNFESEDGYRVLLANTALQDSAYTYAFIRTPDNKYIVSVFPNSTLENAPSTFIRIDGWIGENCTIESNFSPIYFQVLS